MAKYPLHESVTIGRVMALVESGMNSLDNPGICLKCGEDADGCEPDAQRYECEACGGRTVYGAEQILLMGVAHADAPESSTHADKKSADRIDGYDRDDLGESPDY